MPQSPAFILWEFRTVAVSSNATEPTAPPYALGPILWDIAVPMNSSLPWFTPPNFPLYLAPMAGVSDKIFRQFCKERGADVLVTEFVSAEGVFRRNERTREYLDFDECERPIGVQLFGGNAEHMAEAAKQVIDWVRPDFVDLKFGCPVNKVVAKNGVSAPVEDCPTPARVATAVVRTIAPMPVTAKI